MVIFFLFKFLGEAFVPTLNIINVLTTFMMYNYNPYEMLFVKLVDEPIPIKRYHMSIYVF